MCKGGNYMKKMDAFARIYIVLFILLTLIVMTALSFADSTLPSTNQKEVIEKAASFLEDMGDTSMAENIRKWVKADKIKINSDYPKGKNGTTNRKGIIQINDDFTKDLPENDLEKFKRLVNLASLLLHEKTHAHQAPQGNALYDHVKTGDWTASCDVMDECVGPDALEVEAYYKKLRAYIQWAQKIENTKVDSSLSKADQEKAKTLKDAKIAYLKAEILKWAKILKKHNYEKSNKVSLGYIWDDLDKINNNEKLSEEAKLSNMKTKLDTLIDNLSKTDNYYDKMRKIYKKKQGEKKAAKTVTKKSEMPVTLTLPDEMSQMIIDQDLTDIPFFDDEEVLTIEVYDFMIPPEPDPGYVYVSPVYDVRMNALLPVDFTMELMVQGENLQNASVVAFGLEKDSFVRFTEIDSELILTGDNEGIIIFQSDLPTMYAVVIPEVNGSQLMSSHWSYDATHRLRHREILDDEDLILPETPVNRQRFMKYLVKSLNLELVETPMPFKDVPLESSYYPYIATAYHHNLTQGIDSETFGYDEPLSREQSMTFLVRARNHETKAKERSSGQVNEILKGFKDEATSVAPWARAYISESIDMGLTQGYPDGSIQGDRLLSHGEVIALIDRMIKNMQYQGEDIEKIE